MKSTLAVSIPVGSERSDVSEQLLVKAWRGQPGLASPDTCSSKVKEDFEKFRNSSSLDTEELEESLSEKYKPPAIELAFRLYNALYETRYEFTDYILFLSLFERFRPDLKSFEKFLELDEYCKIGLTVRQFSGLENLDIFDGYIHALYATQKIRESTVDINYQSPRLSLESLKNAKPEGSSGDFSINIFTKDFHNKAHKHSRNYDSDYSFSIIAIFAIYKAAYGEEKILEIFKQAEVLGAELKLMDFYYLLETSDEDSDYPLAWRMSLLGIVK